MDGTGHVHGLPALGRRGGGWVAGHVVLLAAIFLSALVELEWPGWLEPVAYTVGALLLAGGVALLGAGGQALGSALTPFPAQREGGGLRMNGVYALVRHPMYGGGILVGLGWSAIFASPLSLALTLVLAGFADLKSRREELWLEQRHPEYGEYRRRTRRRFLPFVW